MRKPNNIMPGQTRELRERLAEAGIPIPDRLDVYVTKTVRGRACIRGRNVTVPLWAYDLKRSDRDTHGMDPDYPIYYACHEIAHIMAPGANHGPKFMAAFRAICPEHLQHFELGYKPRNARAAGIRSPKRRR
jgi:hypothetical protein